MIAFKTNWVALGISKDDEKKPAKQPLNWVVLILQGQNLQDKQQTVLWDLNRHLIFSCVIISMKAQETDNWILLGKKTGYTEIYKYCISNIFNTLYNPIFWVYCS